MNRVFVHGSGAVSPAGWGVPALRGAVENHEPLPIRPLARPGWAEPLWVRQVPPPPAQPAFFAHPRLRRAGAISQYVVAAALEALGDDVARVQSGSLRLGVVLCVFTGGVRYSRRFFEELLRDPATASPLLFPETVFNAPASHLAAYLDATGANYTLVGDNGAYLQGLALAAHWLWMDRADSCVVVGAEETDWIVADAVRLFQPQAIHSEGAGALYLRPTKTPASFAELTAVTDSFPFVATCGRCEAARKMRAQLPTCGRDELLLLGTQGLRRADAPGETAWREWTGPRLAPKAALGEAFTAAAAWECVLACEALRRGEFRAANVSVVGVNQQAIGARFVGMQS